MRRKIRILTICMLFAVSGNSQPLLTVEEAVAATLQHNYDIQLFRNDSTLFTLQNSFAYAAFLPRLNATGTWLFNHNNAKQELADGTKREQNNLRSNAFQSSLNLNWTIFDGLKMFATRDRLAETVTLGKENLKNQVSNSVAQTINTYYGIVRQKQQLVAIREQMALNEERITQAERKLSVGLGAKPELLQARLDLNAQQAAIQNQELLIEQLKEELNLLMAFKPGTTFEVEDSIPINREIILDDITTTAEANNPGILSAMSQLRIAEFGLKERKAERFPTISLNSAYNFSRNVNKAVINPFTTLFNQNHGFNYGVTATIPIFNNFTVKRQIKEAEIEIDYRKLLLDYEKQRVQAEVMRAYKTYLRQQEILALEEENITFAKENVFIAGERYRLGLSTILELRESQRSLDEAYFRLIAARYNAKVSETELLRLQGSLVR